VGSIQPDFTFVRGGRPLAQWLPEVVCDDVERRRTAADALYAMHMGIPEAGTDYAEMDGAWAADFSGQSGRWERAVREAAASPSFPLEVFLRDLLSYRMLSMRDWLERCATMYARDEALDERQDQLIRTWLTGPDAQRAEQAGKRFGRIVRGLIERDWQLAAGSEMSHPAWFVSGLVLNALDSDLVIAHELFPVLLLGEEARWEAVKVLERAGAGAASYGAWMVEELDRLSDEKPRFDLVTALGRVCRADEGLASAVADRLRHTAGYVRMAAAETLVEGGPCLGARTEEIVALLRQLRDTSEFPFAFLRALASVGRRRPDVAREVVALTEGGEAAVHIRAVALDSLAFLTGFPELAIPALVRALSDFEEFDPDEGGPHDRIVRALTAFDDAATPAIPALLSHVRQPDGSPDPAVIRLLGHLGPAAAVAAPTLAALLAERPPQEGLGAALPLDPEIDPLPWALQRITAGGPRSWPG